MSFVISAMPQSIQQPLGVLNLPGASLESLRFENYQQKQEEALRVDIAADTRQVQQQRAQAQSASHDINTTLENIQDTSDISPIQSLDSIFERQRLMDSIAAGEQKALQASAAGAQTPGDGGKNATIDPLLDIGETAAAEKENAQLQPLVAETEAEARQQQRDEMLYWTNAVKEGQLLASNEGEDSEPSDVTTRADDAFRQILEQAATRGESLSLSSTGTASNAAPSSSPLTAQLKADSFIAEVQRMQAMQFGHNHGQQLSIAA